VQLLDRQEVVEAYEITANNWRTKLRQADAARRERDLKRVHVIADALGVTGSEVRVELERQGLDPNTDVSVLDYRHEVRSTVGDLSKVRRRDALERLYALLVQHQTDDELVRYFVERLRARDLLPSG
jgi:hypothetical protein